MKNNDIDQFLRENKPVVRDDPAFLLETSGRMDRVEGLKKEMDRQHRYGWKILVLTLVLGLLVGAAACTLAYLHHVNLVQVSNKLEQFLRTLYGVKEYLALAAGLCLAALCYILANKETGLFSR